MWHVAQTAPHSELKVCRFFALHGLPSYAPEFDAPRRTRPGSVRDGRHRWIFPGYVLFQAPRGFTSWDLVHWAPGVRRVLGEDGSPAGLDDAVLAQLQQRVAAARTSRSGDCFRTGQRVVVTSGPLAMVDALFDRALKAPDRVSILVSLLGRRVSVDVDPAVLRAAS